MNITEIRYVTNPDGDNVSILATIDGQEMFVPFDPRNTHYAEILKQVADGDLTIDAAPVLDEE